MNKFIFLDIDGVMNSNLFYSERTQDKRYNELLKFHPQRLAWRFDDNLQEVFTLSGIEQRISDRTPWSKDRFRGSEIQEWLDKQTEPYGYVILDDDNDMLDSQLPYFIQTDWLKWGLSDEDVEQAIHILNADD